MKTARIRERNGEFQVYEKDTNRIVFRGKTWQECFDFFLGNDEYEPTRKKGVHYVY